MVDSADAAAPEAIGRFRIVRRLGRGATSVVYLAHDAALGRDVVLKLLSPALSGLERRHPRHARTVECRFFGGMGVDDTAAALGISPRTVKSDWAMARAWLYDALQERAP